MWGRAHPQGNVALPLSLYLSPSRLSVSFFPCLAGCSSIASQFMGMTTLIDSLFVCVRMGTCWWTIFQTSPAVVWIIRSFSSHATNIALLLCIRLGRLAASLARGWGWEGVGWGGDEGPYFTMAVQQQCINRETAKGLLFFHEVKQVWTFHLPVGLQRFFFNGLSSQIYCAWMYKKEMVVFLRLTKVVVIINITVINKTFFPCAMSCVHSFFPPTFQKSSL